MINLYGLPLHKLEQLMLEEGQKKYRATQLYIWMYEKKATNFDEMTDVSKSFREVLKEKYCLSIPEIDKKQVSQDGTIKLLLKLKDNSKVETVLMHYNYGYSACVSSQVGCNMGCSFCASGLLGKKRNLEPEEIVGQVLVLNNILKEEGKGQHITHVVVMGTGEPFDNYDNVMDFIRIINNQKGLSIGARHITVSTCGIPDKIIRYAGEGLQTNLAISLHAPNNEIRNSLMKVNKVYPVEKVIEAVKEAATIDIKRDEIGLNTCCQRHGWPVIYYTAEQLRAVLNVPPTSRINVANPFLRLPRRKSRLCCFMLAAGHAARTAWKRSFLISI